MTDGLNDATPDAAAETKADPCDPAPLAYHRDIVGHLRTAEPDLWAWYAAAQHRKEEADAIRLELLKATYRLDAGAYPQLFAQVDALCGTMNVGATVAIYQAQSGEAINASLAYLPGEAHIVLAGPVLTVLSEDERKALLAHELAHYLLLADGDGAYRTAADLVRALANDPAAGPEYAETARLYSLYTEVFADRWALRANGDLATVVRTLVKAQTGLAEVSAESYLRQAADIFRSGPVTANQPTHPELFIRARALELWAADGDAADAGIERLIQGPLCLERLDLLAQVRAASLTRRMLRSLLTPAWFRTEATLAHARQFFPDIDQEDGDPGVGGIAEALGDGAPSLRDYACFVLLDFATVDRDLGEAALAASLLSARAWRVDERFAELAQKERGITKKTWARVEQEAADLVNAAARATPSGKGADG